jgi:type I restriction enzyme, S subunit
MGCDALYDARLAIPGEDAVLFDLATWKNGLAFKKIDFSDSGIPVIKIAELNNGIGASTSFTKGVYPDDVKLQKGDFVFSWSGNPETSIDIFRFGLEEGWLNQHIFKVTPNDSLVTKDYFFYLMKWLKPVFKSIASNKQTTGLGHVTISDLKKIKVTVPAKGTQTKVAAILAAIDEKVSLNTKLNGYLAA